MKTIEITNDYTKIHFEFDSEIECRAYPPGNENAFFIKDALSDKTYKLLNIEGLSIYPQYSITEEFTLTFEKIPNDLFQFHLIEGVSGLEYDEDAINFMNVVIPSL